MPDDIGRALESRLEAEAMREPDLGWVVARGHRLRTLRRVALGVAAVAIVATASTAVMALGTDRQETLPVIGDHTPSVDDGAPAPGIVEEMTDQEQAEVFAFRALAHTGLMDPYAARSYNWTYAEDTTRIENGWRVGFAASDCEPREGSHTCRGLSGEDPESGNALTDTFLIVRSDGDRWVVVDVEGKMLLEERQRVIGYSLPRRDEPSHWDFAAVGIWPHGNGEYGISMVPIWVGPYPTEAPGSMCQTYIVLASDTTRPLSSRQGKFYEEAPDRPFERGGWVRGTGFVSEDEVERAEVHCHQASRPQRSATPQAPFPPPEGPRELIANGTFTGSGWGELYGEGWWLYAWQRQGHRCWVLNVVDDPRDDSGRVCGSLENGRGSEYIGGVMGTPASAYEAKRSIFAGELRTEVAYIEIELDNGRTYRVDAIAPDPSLGIDARYFVAFADPSDRYSIRAFAEDGSLLQARNFDGRQ